MKKYIKIIIVCLLIMFGVMTISRIVSPIIEKSKIADRYKDRYNIEFITPEKLEEIFFEGLRDPNYLNKLTYDKETYQKILEYDYVLPIDKRDVQKLIDKEIIHLLEKEENIKIFKEISTNIVEDENNYYAYLEKPGFYHELFLFDVDECTLYILTLVF
ncbi:MAG TPA: hypothetical protein IAB65_05845 [Candidatus Onthocola stercorigallinarum]|nr:hypothetical protein [Candidatus Onthocola stercorigallinarum]